MKMAMKIFLAFPSFYDYSWDFFFLQPIAKGNCEVIPKNYENGHENIFGLSVALESKVENSKNLEFIKL